MVHRRRGCATPRFQKNVSMVSHSRTTNCAREIHHFVSQKVVATPPGLRSRPRSRVREPDRRLAATITSCWRENQSCNRARTRYVKTNFLSRADSASPRRRRAESEPSNSARTPDDSYRRYMSKTQPPSPRFLSNFVAY
ncbi:hypothetical protein PUN28_007903 [Cardiocondyla obscurior]|uniref:Uncharacterized protein n=1 Tax=Cardiocondyla obscurior TaxID=286306 RepID=A0AAW2FXF4_9HYME